MAKMITPRNRAAVSKLCAEDRILKDITPGEKAILLEDEGDLISGLRDRLAIDGDEAGAWRDQPPD